MVWAERAETRTSTLKHAPRRCCGARKIVLSFRDKGGRRVIQRSCSCAPSRKTDASAEHQNRSKSGRHLGRVKLRSDRNGLRRTPLHLVRGQHDGRLLATREILFANRE